MRWVGHAVLMGEMGNSFNIVRTSELKRPLRRPRHSREDNMRMDLMEIGWEVVDWMQMDQDRNQWQILENKVMNLLVP
jgi:hypothetical protein